MTDHELTRRDAIAALAAAGVAVTAAPLTWERLAEEESTPALSDAARERLDAVARVVYPSEVSGVPDFVETYVVGRIRDRPERVAGMADALEYLDIYSREWYDTPFLDLSPDRRGTVLQAMGVNTASPDPEGTDAGKVRFYVVNELLYALYSSPTGGELLGLENPQGYPGGTDSYRRGP